MRALRIFFQFLSVFLLIGVAAFASYTIITFRTISQSLVLLQDDLTSVRNTLAQSSQETREHIEAGEQRVNTLADFLRNEQKRIDTIVDSVKGVDRTVGQLSGSLQTLEKLTTTDRQLLQKYSKVYFLNEHYMPEGLEFIDEKYDFIDGKQVSVHVRALPFLEKLLKHSWDDGVPLMVLSGYRSFTEQGTLKQAYTQRYGVGANQFSADQGYSEHQLGTAVDFTTQEIGGNLNLFRTSPQYEWLKKNAFRYGFTLSYPENNEYYIYEPWHWRFVGIELATHLHKKGTYFYDLEQREIDSYLPTLFDK